MKENSIEEAIERLEYIDRTYSYNNYYSIWDLKCIEIILSDYKRVLKENEELEEENKSKQKAYDDCYCEYKHYKQFDSIPKSKVKEKIEELKQKAISYGTFIDKDESFNIQSKISVLQELL